MNLKLNCFTKRIIMALLVFILVVCYGSTVRLFKIIANYSIYAQEGGGGEGSGGGSGDGGGDYDEYDEDSEDLSCCGGDESGTQEETTSSEDTACTETEYDDDYDDYDNDSSSYNENDPHEYWADCGFKDTKCIDKKLYKCNKIGYWVRSGQCIVRCAFRPECGFDSNGNYINACCKP